MATSCGWALEYIDNLGMADVFELSEYWAIEPPANWLLKGFTGYSAKGEEMQDERLFTQTVNQVRKPFDQLPAHIQQLIITQSGLSEKEFHKRRIEARKKELKRG